MRRPWALWLCVYAAWSSGSLSSTVHRRRKVGLLTSRWFTEDKPVLKKKDTLINLPYVIDNGRVITQTNSCLIYLGRKLNLWGTNEVEISECEQLLCEIYDLRGAMTGLAYPRDFTVEKATTVVERQVKHGNLRKIEAWLGNNPLFSETTPYLVGGHCTAPDFHLLRC